MSCVTVAGPERDQRLGCAVDRPSRPPLVGELSGRARRHARTDAHTANSQDTRGAVAHKPIVGTGVAPRKDDITSPSTPVVEKANDLARSEVAAGVAGDPLENTCAGGSGNSIRPLLAGLVDDSPLDARNKASASTGGSRRKEQRAARRQWRFHRSLELLVGVCVMTGARGDASPADWKTAVDAAPRQLRRASYARSLNWPTWAIRLFKLSDLSRHESLTSVQTRCTSTALRFSRSLMSVQHPESTKDILDTFVSDDYTFSKAKSDDSFRAIDPAKLALPTLDQDPVDLVSALRQTWPYNIVLSPTNLARCLRTAEEKSTQRRPRGHVALIEGASYDELIRLLAKHRMLIFFRVGEGPFGPDNGLFAVPKGADLLRLILDGKPGNFEWSQGRFKEIYAEVIRSNPKRAQELGLTERLMPMPSPASVTQLPDGVEEVGGTDFKAFFYTLQQLEEMVGSQKLPAVDGARHGLGSGRFSPYMRVMSMGNWLSAILAQLIHRMVMRPLVAKPLRYLQPRVQSSERREAYARLHLLATPEGMVKRAEVPSLFWKELSLSGLSGVEHLADDVLIPVAAFLFQPTLREANQPTAATGIVEMHTALMTDGPEMRQALLDRKDRLASTGVGQHQAMASLYIDDNNSFYYGVSRTGWYVGYEDGDDHALNCAQMLATLSTALGRGLTEAYEKLRWPSRKSGKALGVEYSFERENSLRFEVAAERRERISVKLKALSRTRDTHVTESVLDQVVGDLVWCMLCRRSFLSLLRVVYKARHSKTRKGNLVALTPALRSELWLAALCVPALYGMTTTDSHILTTYDASGASSSGRGGYGVAFRTGLHPRAAAEFTTSYGGQLGKLPAFREEKPGEPPPERMAHASRRPGVEAASKTLAFNWERPTGPWMAAHRGQFKRSPSYIAVAEILTGLLAARFVGGRERPANGKVPRYVVGGDNSVASTCLLKGRSSTRALNDACRKVAATEFVRSVVFGWFWMPSKSNPADGPSRWWEDSRPRTRVGRLRRKQVATTPQTTH